MEGASAKAEVCVGWCQVEDLLEYYMQRAATLQSESERLLAGARDLEESIGVSLSARRFEARLSHPPHLLQLFIILHTCHLRVGHLLSESLRLNL